MELTQSDFEFVRKWAKDEAAIEMAAEKKYLVESKLGALLDLHGVSNISDLVAKLRESSPSSQLFKDCIDALTIHETSFFRGTKQYEFLKNRLFPSLLDMKLSNKRLAIWSAACSTGQELYTIAMIIRKHFPEMQSWDLQLHGTDVSDIAIKSANEGKYNPFEISRGLPEDYLKDFFVKTDDGNYVISDELKQMVEYKPMNLAGRWPYLPPYHIIFMRNVMIYFSDDTKKKIFEKLKMYLHTGGILILGGTETALDIDSDWKAVCEDGIVYYKLDEI